MLYSVDLWWLWVRRQSESSTNSRVDGLISGLFCSHVKVCLGKTLNPYCTRAWNSSYTIISVSWIWSQWSIRLFKKGFYINVAATDVWSLLFKSKSSIQSLHVSHAASCESRWYGYPAVHQHNSTNTQQYNCLYKNVSVKVCPSWG